ncbi:MAG: hypothetical protein HZA15_06625 [Nitrospirae bacterium]|nr:hypothetical protein [Nitrospirota bacterium]
MQAIREIKSVKGKKIIIDLPEDFRDQKVEVIVLPFAEETEKKRNLNSLLMDGPTLTDEEIRQFMTVREDMKRWKIKEF